MTMIGMREPTQSDAEQLATMLCADAVLRRDLGIPADERPTAEDVLQKLADWCPSRRATTYAILADAAAVGTISISHRSPDGLSAQIGYWIGSGHRHLGYCTRAFATVLAQAASEGIVAVSATIAADNTPSRRVWERRGAKGVAVSAGELRYELAIERQQTGGPSVA
jgi:RimJ/RimL family protein N-acetyltransferase